MPNQSDVGKARRRGAVIMALACLGLAAAAAPAAATQAEYDKGYELGTDAYKYGLPLVTMNKTYKTQTSVNVSNGRGSGPPNRFNHVRRLVPPGDRTVVAPNYDTLYSIAWLNLKKQPQVIRVPKVKKRYFVIPLMDPYTEDFKNLGTVSRTKPGDYAVVGPGQHKAKLPRGVKRIKSDYTRVWIIARTYIDESDPDDLERVHRIQNRMRITPLSKYGKQGWKPRKPKKPDTEVNEAEMPTGLQFFNRLGKELEKFPPPAADQPELDKLAGIGVGPGMKPAEAGLPADTLRGMKDAVADGPDAVFADVTAAYLGGFAAHNGYLVMPTGTYGTDYSFRATVTRVGLGALRPEESIYPFAQLGPDFQPLSGNKRYVLHIPPGGLPPVKAFWSLTLYDSEGFFVPNEIDRYLVNDRTKLAKNGDGSIDIYIQSSKPENAKQAKNWLPSPPGANFRLIWRLYHPKKKAIDGILTGEGWTAPSIQPLAG